MEWLEGRALLATLAQVPDINVPQYMGYQVSLEGGSGGPQTFTVTSSNPKIAASVAQGQFWNINVSHASSGSTDPSFNGSMTFQLFEDLTPLTTSRIETLINQGFYTGKNFHRVASGFPGANDYIVQGGSPDGKGSGEVNQPGYPFADEFVQQLAFTGKALNADPNSIYSTAGQLAMANAGDDTNSSQFFATTGDPRFLDYQHTIFGQLTSGQQILQQITKVALNGTTPVNPVLINSTSLAGGSPDGVLHLDTSEASAGETATITVTATDPVDNSTVTRTFQVMVQPNPAQQRPFISPAVQNQVVGVVRTTPSIQGQTAVFQVDAVNPNPPGTVVKYVVQGGVSGTAFLPVQNATAMVSPTGVVTVTPIAGFTGVINLVVGVGGPTANTSAPGDFDTQRLTVTVVNTSEINLVPIALSGTSTAVINTPSPIQLAGLTGNPASSQTLTYEIVTPPTSGTISQFNPQTGQFLYTGNPGFQGSDTATFRVTDVGAPTPNLTSATATQTINVGGGQTGAVRLIDDVLVVSAPPRRDSVPNKITVDQTAAGQIVVTVNGLQDITQPDADLLTKIVVYGSKANDEIVLTEAVTVSSTLDGGRGGDNFIQGGGGTNRAHLWFGKNRYEGGITKDRVYGRAGQFRVARSGGDDKVFAGTPRRRATLHRAALPPGGTFYRFVDGVLVKQPPPKPPHRA